MPNSDMSFTLLNPKVNNILLSNYKMLYQSKNNQDKDSTRIGDFATTTPSAITTLDGLYSPFIVNYNKKLKNNNIIYLILV